MPFDINGRVTVNIQNGYATVTIDRVDYDSNVYDRSGSVQFTLWATTAPYHGGTIHGYRLLDYRPSNDTLRDGGYYYDVRFGDQVSAPRGNYYLTVTVQEYSNGRYLINDYTTFTNHFAIGGGSTGGGGEIIRGDDYANDLDGTDASERIYGYGGNDFVLAYAGNDTVYGGRGNDSVSGGYGNDVLDGGNGRDLLSGQNGNDTLFGRNGDDNLGGNSGHDRLFGGAGNDYLYGDLGGSGRGRDTLVGGSGADVMAGGAGADRFVFQSRSEIASGSAGRDRITDFSRSEGDRIDLSKVDANENRGGNQDFTFIGTKTFSGRAGELRFAKEMLRGDTDGDGQADFIIMVEDVRSLQRGDLIL
ncbi:calcium-binding protein [Gemmobacter serpentinus]|uniref:calcium-binding protein n=1 Tax=Gemmobacter serpentinus TaxID=2652247 RepID=UPI00124D06F9|nr:type I secretion C-terminal target domain-containing protein [Gemmobacter serpentinus]